MEHKNYERELKYLIEKGLSITELQKFFEVHGYKVVEARSKQKHEDYYDDKNLSLLNRGDVVRGSKHIYKTHVYPHFMYKKDMSDPSKPYVTRLEVGSGEYKSVDELILGLGLDFAVQSSPILHAEMERDMIVIERDMEKLLVCNDTTKYFTDGKTNLSESMLELEDWTNPNQNTELRNVDASLLEAHELLRKSGLPIKLTKHTKPYRGYKILGEHGIVDLSKLKEV